MLLMSCFIQIAEKLQTVVLLLLQITPELKRCKNCGILFKTLYS